MMRNVARGSKAAVLVMAVAMVAAAGVRARTQGARDLHALLADAQKSFAAERLDEAERLFGELRDAGRDAHDELMEGRGWLGLGSVANAKARYPAARPPALEALARFERVGGPHDIALANHLLGIVAANSNADDEARMRYAKAIAAFKASGDERMRLVATRNMARVDSNRPAESIAILSALLPEIRALGDKDLEASALHTWADRLFNAGEYEAAIEKLAASQALYGEVGNPQDLATVYNSLGRIYRLHGQPLAALDCQLAALAIHEKMNSPRFLVQSLNAVAVSYHALGDDAHAREFYERALAEARKTASPSIIDVVQSNLGDFLVTSGQDVERGRQLIEDTVARTPPNAMWRRMNQLSAAYKNLGKFEKARELSTRAIEVCGADPYGCVLARAGRANAELELGDEDSALADNDAAIAGFEAIHRNLAASDFLKSDFHGVLNEVYSVDIRLHAGRGDDRRALETAELARSRAFVDLLASREIDADRAPGAPTSIEVPLRGGTSASLAVRSAATARPASAEDLAAAADRLNSTIVTYWVGNDEIHMWVVRADGAVHGARVAVARARLDALLRSVTPFAPPPGAPSPAQTIASAAATRGEAPIQLAVSANPGWRTLYDLLVQPIEKELPRKPGARLTIVPHGPLLSLPFAALRGPDGRYLIERFTIHEVPAGAVLKYTAARRQADARTGPALLVADPASPPRVPGERPLPRLNGAREEVQAISRLLRTKPTVLQSADATEHRVLEAVPGKRVIHFATHAIVRETDPLSSFLALGADASADGRLTSEKMYGLRLDADLVVLSACRSAGGVMTGDGIAALARAFFYAGTPSLVASVWDVADEPTKYLLPEFYRRWLNGADKATALRAAQLALIRQLRAGTISISTRAGRVAIPEDPEFWAGFVLLGEPD